MSMSMNFQEKHNKLLKYKYCQLKGGVMTHQNTDFKMPIHIYIHCLSLIFLWFRNFIISPSSFSWPIFFFFLWGSENDLYCPTPCDSPVQTQKWRAGIRTQAPDGIRPCFYHRVLKLGRPAWYTTKNNCPSVKGYLFSFVIVFTAISKHLWNVYPHRFWSALFWIIGSFSITEITKERTNTSKQVHGKYIFPLLLFL